MKKSITLLALGAIALGAHAQYQVQNSGFEEWESVTYKKKTGDEPVHWSSFLDGSGTLMGTAAAVQLEKSTETRPGSTGSTSAKIYARNVLTVIAQGNMTTGCVNMGSVKASDASGNYNYTDTSNSGHNQPFTGLPDAMHVWVKFNTSSEYKAKATTILHTDGYYQDPLGNESKINAKLVATAANTEISSSSDWQELTIPFTYSLTDGTRPAYALVSFATSSTPGSGNKNDYMYIDDLSYVYYHALSALSYNGTSILDGDKTAYDLSTETYDASKLAYTKKAVGGMVETSYDEDNAVLTITVKGDNYSADNTSVTTYTIQFKKEETVASSQLTSLSVDGTAVTGFDPATYSYTIAANYSENTQVTYTASDDATVTESYNEETGAYTINVATDDETNTYTLQFNKPKSATSYSNSLSVSVNGETTAPQTTNFQIITRADGTTVFVLKNFMLGEGDEAMAVGNIKLVGVTVSGKNYTTNQSVTIEPGDDESISEDEWLGPQLDEVPVVLNGTLSDSQFNATIDIDMQSTLEQTIKVVLAPEVQVNKETDVELSDGLANVVFSRSFNKGWSTLVLPFDYTAEQLGASQIATLSAANSSDVYFTLSEDSKFEANTPYLVNFDAATDVEFTYGGEVQATDETNDASYKLSDDSTFMFAANYTANLSLANLGMTCYGLVNDGTESYIQKAGSSATLPSTCCYFALANVEPGAMEPLSFSVKFTDGTMDGINSDLVIENGEVKEKAHGIYNLQGVKVANDSTKGLPAGLYIANGKKVLVK